MNHEDTGTSRRTLLKLAGFGALSIPVALLLPGSARAQTVKVDPATDPQAKALEYVHASTVDGQNCTNCQFYQGGTDAWGPCPLFPGKAVAGEGWCKSWIKKAG